MFDAIIQPVKEVKFTVTNGITGYEINFSYETTFEQAQSQVEVLRSHFPDSSIEFFFDPMNWGTVMPLNQEKEEKLFDTVDPNCDLFGILMNKHLQKWSY